MSLRWHARRGATEKNGRPTRASCAGKGLAGAFRFRTATASTMPIQSDHRAMSGSGGAAGSLMSDRW